MQHVERMDHSFYLYEGSFTTPPYTEGVTFIVMQEIQYITFAGIEISKVSGEVILDFLQEKEITGNYSPLMAEKYTTTWSHSMKDIGSEKIFMLPDSSGS